VNTHHHCSERTSGMKLTSDLPTNFDLLGRPWVRWLTGPGTGVEKKTAEWAGQVFTLGASHAQHIELAD
jgi:hypothetical protein